MLGVFNNARIFTVTKKVIPPKPAKVDPAASSSDDDDHSSGDEADENEVDTDEENMVVKVIEPPSPVLPATAAIAPQAPLPPAAVPAPVLAAPPAAVVESHHPAAVLPEGLTVTRIKTSTEESKPMVETSAPPVPISGTTITKISVPVNEQPTVPGTANPMASVATQPPQAVDTAKTELPQVPTAAPAPQQQQIPEVSSQQQLSEQDDQVDHDHLAGVPQLSESDDDIGDILDGDMPEDMSDLLNAVDPAQDDVPPPQPAKGSEDSTSAPGGGSGPTNSMPDLGLDMPMLMDAVDMGGGSKPKDASQTPSSKQGAPTVEVKKATESEAAFEKLFQSTPTPAPTDVKPLNKPLMAVASNDIQGKHDFFVYPLHTYMRVFGLRFVKCLF